MLMKLLKQTSIDTFPTVYDPLPKIRYFYSGTIDVCILFYSIQFNYLKS